MESCLHRLGSYVFIVFVLIFQGIDTVSGFTTIVINTEVVLDDVFPYFANSNTILFSNNTGKILLGSWYFQDNWLHVKIDKILVVTHKFRVKRNSA